MIYLDSAAVVNGQPLAPSAMLGPPSLARVYRSRILIPVWLNRKPTGPPRSPATSLITAARPRRRRSQRAGISGVEAADLVNKPLGKIGCLDVIGHNGNVGLESTQTSQGYVFGSELLQGTHDTRVRE